MISKVAIEATSASSGGAIRFLSQVCPAMSEANPGIQYYLLNRSAQFSRLPTLPDNFNWIRVQDQTQWVPFRLVWLQTALPRILTEIGADVLLAASDVSTLRSPCPMVLMVHNINPFSPLRSQVWDRRQLARMAVHRRIIHACARRAARVVFVSEWSREAMMPALGVPEERTSVVYHGVDEVFKSGSARIDTEDHPRFILAVSDVLEHKNFTRLIDAYISLTRCLDEEVRLVVAGEVRSERLRHSLQSRLAGEGISDRVSFLGQVPLEELADLYRRAAVLVYPSLGETFGLPLIEAMASGLPVAVSNVSAMPEICQDAACYFDPLDVDDMARVLERLLTDSQLREDLTRRGLKRSEEFSWSNTATNLLLLLEGASARSGALV